MILAHKVHPIVDHLCQLIHMHPVLFGDGTPEIQRNCLCELLIHIFDRLGCYLGSEYPGCLRLRIRLPDYRIIRFLPLPVFWIIEETAKVYTDHSSLRSNCFRRLVGYTARMVNDFMKSAVTVYHRVPAGGYRL